MFPVTGTSVKLLALAVFSPVFIPTVPELLYPMYTAAMKVLTSNNQEIHRPVYHAMSFVLQGLEQG